MKSLGVPRGARTSEPNVMAIYPIVVEILTTNGNLMVSR